MMTRIQRSEVLALLVLAGAVAPPAAWAVVPGALENPYGVITNRNAFGIRPPPEPEVAAPVAPPAPPPNVFLTGVTHQRGKKRAFFVINRPGAKAPDYESAMEGDEIQDLKIQEINAKEGRVRVLVGGREVVLNFTDNGMKSTGAGVPPQVPGRPSGAVVPPVAPVPQTGGGGGGGPVIIGRGGVRMNEGVGQGGNAASAPAVYPGATGAVADGGGIPVQVPVADRMAIPAPRSLPTRASSGGASVGDQVSPGGGISETLGGRPLPIPPSTRITP